MLASRTLPKSRSRMPEMILARRSMRSLSVAPSLLDVTSTSSKRPLKSFSEGVPTLEPSMALKISDTWILSSESCSGALATFWKS